MDVPSDSSACEDIAGPADLAYVGPVGWASDTSAAVDVGATADRTHADTCCC